MWESVREMSGYAMSHLAQLEADGVERLGVLAPWVHYQEKPIKLSNHPFRRGFA